MKIRDLLSPFILIGVGLAFVIVSCLVILTKGNNRRLIASKMKIGAFLLTFTWFASGCGPVVQCYAPAPPENMIQIIQKSPINSEYNNFIPGDTVFGYINQATFYSYSYNVIDSISNQIKQTGILTVDSIKYKDKFVHFILDSKLDKGTYTINYTGTDSLNTKQSPINSHDKIYVK